MIVVDIETTGIHYSKHGIVSIGAIDLNDTTRSFYEECRVREDAHIMDEALEINGFSHEDIHDANKQTEKELVEHFLHWAEETEEHTMAGHNTGFDHSFIQESAHRYGLNISLPHRTFDLHSMCYMHMVRRGLTPPVEKKRSALNSDTVMTYVGLQTEPKPHNALNGALWEAEAFSRLLYDKNLLPQFAHYAIPWLE